MLKKNTAHIALENTNAHLLCFAANGPNAKARGSDRIIMKHISIFMVCFFVLV